MFDVSEVSSKHRSYFAEVAFRLGKLSHYFQVDVIGCVLSKYPFYKVSATRPSQKPKPNVIISAGIHGEEPAGVYAVMRFLEDNVWGYIDRFNFYVYPCMNPHGFEHSRRENANGVDINQHFGVPYAEPENIIIQNSLSAGPKEYLFSMDHHETDTSNDPPGEYPEEFHMWEVCLDKDKRIGHKIVSAVEEAGIKVCKWDTICGDTNSGGVICYPEGCGNPKYAKGRTLEAYLHKNYTSQSMTIETWTGDNLEERIMTHILSLETALDNIGH